MSPVHMGPTFIESPDFKIGSSYATYISAALSGIAANSLQALQLTSDVIVGSDFEAVSGQFAFSVLTDGVYVFDADVSMFSDSLPLDDFQVFWAVGWSVSIDLYNQPVPQGVRVPLIPNGPIAGQAYVGLHSGPVKLVTGNSLGVDLRGESISALNWSSPANKIKAYRIA